MWICDIAMGLQSDRLQMLRDDKAGEPGRVFCPLFSVFCPLMRIER